MNRFTLYYDLAAALAAGGTRIHDAGLAHMQANWHGAASFTAAIAYLRRGASARDLLLLRAALDAVDLADRDQPRSGWTLAPVGAMPDVPAFLAGHPANMRTPAIDPAHCERQVVLLMVGTPREVAASTMAAWAMRHAALALRIAETSPVELWIGEAVRSDNGQDLGWAVRVDPMDVAHIVALSSAQGARVLGLNLLARAGGHGVYPLQCGDGSFATVASRDRYARAAARSFGFPPSTRVVLPP